MIPINATLAQSFTTEVFKGGLYATAIDLFFKTKDPIAPITIEIHEMEGGFPGVSLVPNSSVTKQASTVSVDAYGQVATKFVFVGPVILEEAKEYAIVIKTNSTKYNAWCATLGQAAINKSVAVAKQPNQGTMFVSANGSTWVPDILTDLCFKIYKAAFTVNTDYTLQTKSAPLPMVFATGNLMETVLSSSTVYFHVAGHGLFVNDKVKLSVNDPTPNTYNGLTVIDINGASGAAVSKEYTVTYADDDCFGVNIGVAATASGYCNVKCFAFTPNLKADLINTVVNYHEPIGTKVAFWMQTRTGASRAGTQSRYNPSTPGYIPVTVNGDVEFDMPIMVANESNKALYMPGVDSIKFRAIISTGNVNISPLVDHNTMHVIAVDHILDDEVTVASRGFVNETDKTAGSAKAKYVSKPNVLSSKASSLQIMFAANIVTGNQVDVYYKTSSTDSIENESWVPMLYVNQTFCSSTNEFKDYALEVKGIPDFTTYAVKLVMRGNNSCACPRISSLRTIALAL